MIQSLYVFHSYRKRLEESAKRSLSQSSLLLETCQRSLIIGEGVIHQDKKLKLSTQDWELYKGAQAYEFLLETICGLKSKLIGEHEIVRQFKDAYHKYLLNPYRSKRITIVLEKLFLDAKSLRTNHLVGLGQRSYGSIVRKILQSHAKSATVLIAGSGQLAEEITQYLRKYFPLMLLARNQQRLHYLSQHYETEVLPWQHAYHYVRYPFIINTIGSQSCELFQRTHIETWLEEQSSGLLIDLSSPGVVPRRPDQSQGRIKGLDDVFHAGAMREQQKVKQVIAARKAILAVLEKRIEWFQIKEEKQKLYCPQLTSQTSQIQLV